MGWKKWITAGLATLAMAGDARAQSTPGELVQQITAELTRFFPVVENALRDTNPHCPRMLRIMGMKDGIVAPAREKLDNLKATKLNLDDRVLVDRRFGRADKEKEHKRPAMSPRALAITRPRTNRGR